MKKKKVEKIQEVDILTKKMMIDTSYNKKLLSYNFNIPFHYKNEDMKKFIKETLSQLKFGGYSIYISNNEILTDSKFVDDKDKILSTFKLQLIGDIEVNNESASQEKI